MRYRWKQASRACLGALLGVSLLFSGCSFKTADGNEMKYVLTTGFSKNEIFRIESESCYRPEMMLYLANIQSQYEEVYGPEIWNTSLENVSLEENVKDIVLAKLAQLKCMQLLAKEYEISLTSEEENKVKAAAKEYYQALSENEINQMGISLDTVILLYQEYLLATKVYDYMIKDVNPEISDDEARSIKVESILIKNYYIDENGQRVEFSKNEAQIAYQKAKSIVEEANNGTPFEELIKKYNEDSKSVYSFGKGDMDPAFEDAAYNLEKEQVSGVVQTQYGYHVIKCLSTFDEEETNTNKSKILEQRKNDAFNDGYQAFVENLPKYKNESAYKSIQFIELGQVAHESVFEVYSKYFGK